MTPTICAEKKQLRASSMKDTRRRHGVASNSTDANPTAALSYVASKGSMSAAARRLRGQRRLARLHRRLPQISDNAVSSSTHVEDERQTAAAAQQQQQALNKEAKMDTDAGISYQYLTTQRMDIDAGEQQQQQQTIHSSRLPGKTASGAAAAAAVLQPTMPNNNNRNHIGKATAKNCDVHHGPVDDDDDDSGYHFGAPKQQHYQHTGNSNNNSNSNSSSNTNTEGLLSIAIKTIKLVQRNKLLQKRLAQLQLETSQFIASVLANPENRHFREKISAKADATSKVSSMLLRH